MISTNMHKLYDNIKLQRSQELNPQVSELHGKIVRCRIGLSECIHPCKTLANSTANHTKSRAGGCLKLRVKHRETMRRRCGHTHTDIYIYIYIYMLVGCPRGRWTVIMLPPPKNPLGQNKGDLGRLGCVLNDAMQ